MKPEMFDVVLAGLTPRFEISLCLLNSKNEIFFSRSRILAIRVISTCVIMGGIGLFFYSGHVTLVLLVREFSKIVYKYYFQSSSFIDFGNPSEMLF